MTNQNSRSVTDAKIDEYKRVKTVFEMARDKSDFDKKHSSLAPNKGIGMALFMHGDSSISNGYDSW